MTELSLHLEPEDINLLADIFSTATVLFAGRKDPAPEWVRDNLGTFAKKVQAQDSEYSRQNIVGEMPYTITTDESQALAYTFYRVLKDAHESQRRVITSPYDLYMLRKVLTFVDKIKDQHLDIIEGM